MKGRNSLHWILALAFTGLFLGVADDSSSTPHDEGMMGGMMPMMQMCHQMMSRQMSGMGGGMHHPMMDMMGHEPQPMTPEEREIAKMMADAEVKEAQLHRMLLEENVNPDALKGKIREIHDLQVEIQFREIMTARAKASAQKPSEKGESKSEHEMHHMGGMGRMGK